MVKIAEIDEEGLDAWLQDRPQIIKDIAGKVPPGRLYLLKSSGHRVFPYSYSEDGTLTVVVSGQFNSVVFERRVFGIDPEDLEECDLPDESEMLGAMLTEDAEIEQFIETVKDND